MLKAVVISDNEAKLEDVGDVLAVARSLGKKLFKTNGKVYVKRLFFVVDMYCWVAIISDCPVVADSLVVSEGKKMRSAK